MPAKKPPAKKPPKTKPNAAKQKGQPPPAAQTGTPPPAPATAAQIAKMQQELQQQQSKIDELTAQLQNAPPPATKKRPRDEAGDEVVIEEGVLSRALREAVEGGRQAWQGKSIFCFSVSP